MTGHNDRQCRIALCDSRAGIYTCSMVLARQRQARIGSNLFSFFVKNFLKKYNKSQFKQQSILYCSADRYLVQINQSYRAPLIIKVPTNDLCLSFCPQVIADATPGSREVPSDLHAASGAVLVPAHQSNKYLV